MGISFDECDAISNTESIASSTEQQVELSLSIEPTVEITSSIEQPKEIKNNVNGKCFVLQYHARNLFTSSKIICCSICILFF
jgi:hypothetical protein